MDTPVAELTDLPASRSGTPRRPWWSAAAAAVLLLGAAACGGDDADGTAGRVDGEGTPSTSAPPGDGPAAGAEPTCEDGTLRGRGFILCTAGETADQGLVVALHGRGSSAADMQAMTRLERAAAAEGLAVAFPESLDGGWGDDTVTSPGRPTGAEDVTFLDDLIRELRADPRIDDRPVGVAGFSNGASMALRYAVERPDEVRAVVSVAGQLPRDPAIRPSRPVPLLQVYGSADPVRSHEAGIPEDADRQPGDPTPTLPTAATVAAFAGTTTVTYDGPLETDPDPADGTRLRTERWLGADDAVVVLHTVIDGGHTWPSAATEPRPDFGRVSRDLDASAEAIAFVRDPRSVALGGDEPAAPAATSPPPSLPVDAGDRLRAALEGLPADQRVDTGAVRAAAVSALPPGSAPPRLAVHRGVTGIAVRNGDGCLMARLADPVEVWSPPRVYLEPGEIGCDPAAAAAGLAQRPPH